MKKAARTTMLLKFSRLSLVALVGLIVIVLVAKGLRQLSSVESFMTDYPGTSRAPGGTPVGFPAWLAWQHFFNFLIIVLLIRAGWLFRTTTRPPAYWTRNNTGVIHTRKPPTKISLDLWFHFSLAWLWVLNGALFYLLIFTTGQWRRVVPLDWDVFANAASAALQYASLDWPTEHGWVYYNGLQLLTYFVTIFIAAPLAIATGLRMSALSPKNNALLNKLCPVEKMRVVHYSVMLYFVAFIIVHVTLVLATGALHNLNHMYGGSDSGNWVGFAFFAASLLVMVGAWLLATPLFLRPVAALTGRVTRH